MLLEAINRCKAGRSLRDFGLVLGMSNGETLGGGSLKRQRELKINFAVPPHLLTPVVFITWKNRLLIDLHQDMVFYEDMADKLQAKGCCKPWVGGRELGA